MEQFLGFGAEAPTPGHSLCDDLKCFGLAEDRASIRWRTLDCMPIFAATALNTVFLERGASEAICPNDSERRSSRRRERLHGASPIEIGKSGCRTVPQIPASSRQ
jgi:hypothetical protein